MTTRTRKAANTAPAKKTTARKATTAKTATGRPARKTTAKKTQPSLSLVKPTPEPPTRHRDFMTDTQGYATLAARIVGITTNRIRDWRDHRDNTATRPLADGSTLHYDLNTRTLTWQAVCPMGAIHQYVLDSPSTAAAARVHADRCQQAHADLSSIPALTADELAALGLLKTPTWARPDVLGEAPTESIPVPLPDRKPRALADELTHSTNTSDDTQPLSLEEIGAHIAEQLADNETPKEHPDHA